MSYLREQLQEIANAVYDAARAVNQDEDDAMELAGRTLHILGVDTFNASSYAYRASRPRPVVAK